MSIKDSNKVIIVSNGMTGRVIIQIPYQDKKIAYDYINSIVQMKILDEEGLVIKIGNRA